MRGDKRDKMLTKKGCGLLECVNYATVLVRPVQRIQKCSDQQGEVP